ncbi:unnamed protein product [Nesidiocoris tenuis]|uniref:Uncharacterized protein n=1 Tax=Nesidiocoris tenuis TaxID=355587 RepID=A0A6H5GZN5_9HEMI|nr:unnamed protein product [Nesidiocoris tenuis]
MSCIRRLMVHSCCSWIAALQNSLKNWSLASWYNQPSIGGTYSHRNRLQFDSGIAVDRISSRVPAYIVEKLILHCFTRIETKPALYLIKIKIQSRINTREENNGNATSTNHSNANSKPKSNKDLNQIHKQQKLSQIYHQNKLN